MTDKPPPPKRRVSSSDELPAVQAFRRKLESIDENVMPLMMDLQKSIERAAASSKPPKNNEDEPTTESVDPESLEVVSDPFPSRPPKEDDEEEKKP